MRKVFWELDYCARLNGQDLPDGGSLEKRFEVFRELFAAEYNKLDITVKCCISSEKQLGVFSEVELSQKFGAKGGTRTPTVLPARS